MCRSKCAYLGFLEKMRTLRKKKKKRRGRLKKISKGEVIRGRQVGFRVCCCEVRFACVFFGVEGHFGGNSMEEE